MADERKKLGEAAGEAAGLTLFALGGVTVFKELHVLEHGDFHLDSLIHTQLGGGETRTEIRDRGVDLTCNSAWTVTGFHLGSSGRIGSDAPQPVLGGHEAAGPALVSRVQTLAKDLQAQAPQGEILVLGTTDPVGWAKREGATNNATLALDRANQVRTLLMRDLGGQQARSVTVANDRLGGVDPRRDGLARMMFGGAESSDRSVLVCVLQPRAPGATITSTGTPVKSGLSFLGGMATGLGSAIVLVLLALILGEGLWGWLEKKLNAGGESRKSLGDG